MHVSSSPSPNLVISNLRLRSSARCNVVWYVGVGVRVGVHSTCTQYVYGAVYVYRYNYHIRVGKICGNGAVNPNECME